MEQLRKTVQEQQAHYQVAKKAETNISDYLDKLTAKKTTIEDELSAFATELATHKAEAEQALARYVADEIGEEELTASRRQVSDLECQHEEAKGLVEALAAEIDKAQKNLKESRSKTQNLLNNCWHHIARLEAAEILQNSAAVLKRAYLAARCTRPYGGDYSIRDFLGLAYEGLHVSDADEASIWQQLEDEYSIPRR